MADTTSHSAPTLDAALNPCLCDWGYRNWETDAAPPVMLNPDADIHTCIAWCWCEAAHLNELALLLCGCTTYEANTALSIIQARLGPLVEMLNYLGTITSLTKADKAKASQDEGKAA